MSLNVLVVHNHYQQPGGEDAVFAAELGLLAGRGHRVRSLTLHNDDVAALGQAALARRTIWNEDTHRRLRALLRAERADVVHFHNTLPLVSPSAYYAAKAEGAAVVQTLHNYRLLCVNSLFFREGRVCEDCFGRRLMWPGVVHACYRNSRAASGVVAAMVAVHRALGTWRRKVDMFIALSRFSGAKFAAGGLPEERIAIKPNFVAPDPGPGTGRGGYALYVGRLSAEKGIRTLLAAWQRVGAALPLKIVGDGPDAPLVEAAAGPATGIEWLGRRPPSEVYALMGEAMLVIVPSDCYETFGRTLVEAFATGTPVVAVGHAAFPEIVTHGRTGLHFRPGDAADLADQVAWAIAHPAEIAAMRPAARAAFEADYTAARNYDMLMAIYRTALAGSAARRQ